MCLIHCIHFIFMELRITLLIKKIIQNWWYNECESYIVYLYREKEGRKQQVTADYM